MDAAGASVTRGSPVSECASAAGVFNATCTRSDGTLRWSETFCNVVTTEGKNFALNTLFEGSAYSAVGPFIGLISSVGYSAVSSSNTAAQINGSNGWKEAGSAPNFPLYVGNRKTCAFNTAAAGSKTLTAPASFLIETTGGTVKGCFIVFGPSATASITGTGGLLWSVGLFSAGDKIVDVGDTLNVSYATSL